MNVEGLRFAGFAVEGPFVYYQKSWGMKNILIPLIKYGKIGKMADTTERIPLWLVGAIGGIPMIVLASVFFYGSYSR